MPEVANNLANAQTDMDVAVFGGGAAGLWLAQTLIHQGYTVQLFTRGALGQGQTLWSQGIVHGGVKYLLQGRTDPIMDAVGQMPERWREHLCGARYPDLRGVDVSCDTCYLFSDGRPWSQLRSFLGGKMLQGKASRVSRSERPGGFKKARGVLYRLQDLVIDVPSMVGVLARDVVSWDIENRNPRFERLPQEGGWRVHLGEEQSLNCTALIFAAGEGNEDLIERAGIGAVPMQRRPLRQLVVHHEQLPDLYTHCIGGGFSQAPELTITTHQSGPRGKWWSLGGLAATDSVDADIGDDKLIASVRATLERFLPGLCPDDADWSVHRVVRAEPDYGGSLPDKPFCALRSGVLVVWPGKLTLVPLLGDMALDALSGVLGDADADADADASGSGSAAVLQGLSSAKPGVLPWEWDGHATA